MPFTDAERQTLRRLAGRVREIADHPSMPERRRRLKDLNHLRADRPVVLCFPEGAWTELLPADALQCADPLARSFEWQLRSTVYWWDHLRDDAALDPGFNVNWRIDRGHFGVDVPYERGEHRGSYVWDPPIKDLDRDFDKLRIRQPRVDRHATFADVEQAEQTFGDLLPVRIRGGLTWTMGVTNDLSRLIGLEPLMLYMFDHPEGLHRLMQFMVDDRMHFITWAEREGLLSLNNAGDYVGSGGFGFTDDLPQPDFDGEHVRLIDLWGHCESQETVGIGPDMFEQFILPYHVPLCEKFGLNCYGCCEPVQNRLEMVLRDIPRVRRVSGAPWVDQAAMKQILGDDYVFSRKPNPSFVCANFDEDAIRRDLRTTLEIAGDGPLDIIMKDTHTVQHEPWRLTRWIEIALDQVHRHAESGSAAKAR